MAHKKTTISAKLCITFEISHFLEQLQHPVQGRQPEKTQTKNLSNKILDFPCHRHAVSLDSQKKSKVYKL